MIVSFEWTSVNEAVPGSGYYLVTRIGTIDRGDKTRDIVYIDLLEYDGTGWVTAFGTVVDNVIAWAKLPRPY